MISWCGIFFVFFFQAEDGIRDLVRSRGLGDVYKRQYLNLFLFNMLILVLGSNLIVMFVGWEGVGLCSYLSLIHI